MFFKRKRQFGKIPSKEDREKARSIITKLVEEFSDEYNLKYNRIAIKNQTTRLGSCSTLKNLNFNWQIIKFPKENMEYIVKHELAHLKHPNHSKAFWDQVNLMDPNYKANHKWIKAHARKYLEF